MGQKYTRTIRSEYNYFFHPIVSYCRLSGAASSKGQEYGLFIYLFILSVMLTITEKILFTLKIAVKC